MTTPTTNFSNPTGLSKLLVSLPASKPKKACISLSVYKASLPHVFIRFGILLQNGIVRKVISGTRPPIIGKLPLFPTGKQIILTFPPNYRLRSGGIRPLKGQLWPRTR